jgi:hypothetical protein
MNLYNFKYLVVVLKCFNNSQTYIYEHMVDLTKKTYE